MYLNANMCFLGPRSVLYLLSYFIFTQMASVIHLDVLLLISGLVLVSKRLYKKIYTVYYEYTILTYIEND